METKIIARVNNVDIISTSDERLVAIKPICEVLGIDWSSQKQRIERDPILSSTMVMITMVAADGKEREMCAIPYMFVFGWLFSIDVSKVNEASREAVLNYKLECYQVLYEHFTEPQTFLKQKQVAIEREVSEYQERQRDFKDARKRMDESKLRLNNTLSITIDDWRANNRQLNLDFESADEIAND